MSTSITTTARNASLQDLASLLADQADVKYDVVTPAKALSFDGGQLVVKEGASVIDDYGVSSIDARLAPTNIFDEGISDRLGIPRQYLRRLRAEHVDLLDANVNGWLEREPDRPFLVRGFRTDDADSVGIARALLSDRFKVIDNYDVLLAVLDAIRSTGVAVNVQGADLSERKLSVKVSAPSVQALAPKLLENYRSPFSGNAGADNPVVFAGFVVSNSETGGGAFTVTPRIVIEVCSNGMTRKVDALRQVHVGGKLDEGLVRWSAATQEKQLDLIKSKTVDAVSTFLDVDYVTRVIDEVSEKAATPLAHPVQAIENISKGFGFTEAESAGILDHFIKGGDTTAGGVLQAVTSYAQVVEDPDRANDLEDVAIDALDRAVALATA